MIAHDPNANPDEDDELFADHVAKLKELLGADTKTSAPSTSARASGSHSADIRVQLLHEVDATRQEIAALTERLHSLVSKLIELEG